MLSKLAGTDVQPANVVQILVVIAEIVAVRTPPVTVTKPAPATAGFSLDLATIVALPDLTPVSAPV